MAAANGRPDVAPENLIVWGEAKGGLQAGIVIANRAVRGGALPAWIVIRNTSEKQTKNFDMVYSWNTLRFAATDIAGATLPTEDSFNRLWGIDTILRVTLGPGEHLEFRAPEVLFAGALKAGDLQVRVDSKADRCRVRFLLDSVIQRDAQGLETGSAEVVLR